MAEDAKREDTSDVFGAKPTVDYAQRFRDHGGRMVRLIAVGMEDPAWPGAPEALLLWVTDGEREYMARVPTVEVVQ